MEKGWNNRTTGATLMNKDSSRSHSIFTIQLEMITTDGSSDEHIRAGKLNLVDLAGSERQYKTGIKLQLFFQFSVECFFIFYYYSFNALYLLLIITVMTKW